ncbi:MAG: lysozyme inhibitor LprI family protein [Oricola sp.]
MKPFLPGLAMVGLSAAPAHAQDWDCSRPGELPQLGINWCAGEEYGRADDALNAAWTKVRAYMKSVDEANGEYFPEQAVAAESLLKAQRAWIDYRDGQCEAEGAQFAGGSIRPLITISCKTRMTRQRTEELLLLMQGN